jgi:methionyl-tRNA formyltransferase
MRVIFMGTPAFAVPALQALVHSQHEVVAAYCQPPRPAGRGKKLRASAVQEYAQSCHIPVHHPTSLKDPSEHAIFAAYTPDVAVVAAYGLLLPETILSAPTYGCINIHPSALPRWRGAAPIQRTIMAGDSETECCIMQMDRGLDTGDVLARTRYPIADGTNAGQLHDVMAAIGAEMILEVLSKPFSPTPQSAGGITYAEKITPADRQIDWSQSATMIRQQILGLSPYPGAMSYYGEERWKILDARLEGTSATLAAEAAAGTCLDGQLLIATGNGALRLTRVQRPGKSPMAADAFLRGTDIPKGAVFT